MLAAGGGGGEDFDYFATADYDYNFASSTYREGEDVYTDVSEITWWSYSRTGTRTAEYVDDSTEEFGPNVPAVTDKGIFIGSADGSSGADVMPLLSMAILGTEATVYAEWHDPAAKASSDIIFCLSGNNPGISAQGSIRPNGNAQNHTSLHSEINKGAIGIGASFSDALNGTLNDNNLASAATSETAIAIGRFATAASGVPDAYIRRIAVFDGRIRSYGLTVLTRQPDMVLVGVGDSITRGDGVDEFLPIVGASLGSNVQVLNFGYNGSSWVYDWPSDPHVGTLTDDLSYVNGVHDVATPQRKKLVAFAGTNGIVLKGNSAAQEYADFETWLAAALGGGWSADDMVVPTMLPRTGVSEVTRGDYNALLVSGASSYGYRLARFDLDPTMGVAGADLNTTYYSDGTHPTTAGHAILAPIVTAAFG